MKFSTFTNSFKLNFHIDYKQQKFHTNKVKLQSEHKKKKN